ncbi:MAG: hypothetical protein ACMUJM_24910 [bacterium]
MVHEHSVTCTRWYGSPLCSRSSTCGERVSVRPCRVGKRGEVRCLHKHVGLALSRSAVLVFSVILSDDTRYGGTPGNQRRAVSTHRLNMGMFHTTRQQKRNIVTSSGLLQDDAFTQ